MKVAGFRNKSLSQGLEIGHFLGRPPVHIATILLLGFLAYSNTFGVPFVFDDIQNIVENLLIRDLSSITTFLSGGRGPFASRPLMQSTFALNYHFGILSTWGYHAVNLGLHLLNSSLFYLLIAMTARHVGYEQRDSRLIAVFSAVLFVAHPLQTEAVTNIIGRSMLLSATFYFLGLILFLKASTSHGKQKAFYAAGLFAAAMLGMASRENFAVFPVILICYSLFFVFRFDVKKAIQNYGLYIPVFLSLIYFAKIVSSNTYDSSVDYPSIGIPPLSYVLTQFNVHWTYLRLLVLPVGQNIDYDYPTALTVFEFPTIISLLGYAGLFVGSVLIAKKRPVVSFSVLWFLITLIPVSFAVALPGLRLGDVIFEHRLYLPSAGLFLLAGATAYSVLKKLNKPVLHAAFIVLFATLALTLATLAYSRNISWHDSITIWEDAVRKSPNKARTHNNLGIAYAAKGLLDSAIEQYQIAIKLQPDYTKAYSNLGSAYLKKGSSENAISYLQRALELDPESAEAHTNLGIAYDSLGLKDEALEHFEAAFKFSPHSDATINNLGFAYLSRGLTDKAAEHLLASLKTVPSNAGAHSILGIIEYRKGRIAEAMEQFRYAVTLDPNNADYHFNLALAYQAMGLQLNASEQFQIAEKLSQKHH